MSFNWSWTKSLPISYGADPDSPFGGTEIRGLCASVDGRLYAVNGYFGGNAPGLPGCCVFRLDGPGQQWQVEYQCPGAVRPDGSGLQYEALSTITELEFGKSDHLLLCGAFSKSGVLDIFERGSDGDWRENSFHCRHPTFRGGGQLRCFIAYRDAMTGEKWAFAGGRGTRDGGGIFGGAFDSDNGHIIWSGDPEYVTAPTSGKGRITAFAELNDKLYACGDDLLVRIDGPSPSWKVLYSPEIRSKAKGNRGCSGLTAYRDHLFFSVQDGARTAIMSYDPAVQAAAKDLDVCPWLSHETKSNVVDSIPAYNDMPLLKHGRDEGLLIGCSYYDPAKPSGLFSNAKGSYGYFMARWGDNSYGLYQVKDESLNDPLVAVRCLVVSPFPNDPPGTLYAGGFDAGNGLAPFKGTGWLYRGVPVS